MIRYIFPDRISNGEYRALAEFRYQLRRFLHFSENAASSAGLEAQQHQLLLAIKGLPKGEPATIGELAERLQLRHHSAVGLVDRLEARGLVRRTHPAGDRRVVVVRLRSRGEKLLRALSLHHRNLLQTAAPSLVASLRALIPKRPGRLRSQGEVR